MGDINHLHNFSSKFKPFVAKEIHRRMSKFFNNRLVQTGYRSRQRNKSSPNKTVYDDSHGNSLKVLHMLYIGQPVVKSHTGADVAASIKEGLDTFGIKAEQLEASSHDGQYFHLSVPEALRNIYGLIGHLFQLLILCIKLEQPMFIYERIEWMVKLFAICKELHNKWLVRRMV